MSFCSLYSMITNLISSISPTGISPSVVNWGWLGEVLYESFSTLGDWIATLFYGLCKWLLAFTDFMQYFIQKLVGIDYWLNNSSYTLSGAIESDLLFSFLYNDTVQTVFQAMIGVFVVLLIIFTIYAIIKNEWAFATGGNGNDANSKTKIFRSAIKAIVTVLIFPIMLVMGIISSNAILASLIKALNIDMSSTFGSTIFYVSSINANRYRYYAMEESRAAVSNEVTFYINGNDQLIKFSNSYSSAVTSTTNVIYYKNYVDYVNAINADTTEKYTVDSVFEVVNPGNEAFNGYCAMLNIDGNNYFYMVKCSTTDEKNSKDAIYYYLKCVLGATILKSGSDSTEVGTVGTTIRKELGSAINSEGYIRNFYFDELGTSSEAIKAAYRTWTYGSIYDVTCSFEEAETATSSLMANSVIANNSDSLFGSGTSLGVSAVKIIYNSDTISSYFDGGQFGHVGLQAEYYVMADVIDFMQQNDLTLYMIDVTSSLIDWNYTSYGSEKIETEWYVSDSEGNFATTNIGPVINGDSSDNNTYMGFVVSYSQDCNDNEAGNVLYLASTSASNELEGSVFIMCYKASSGNTYVPVLNNSYFYDSDGTGYRFSSDYYSSNYTGIVIAKGTFDTSSTNRAHGQPTYLVSSQEISVDGDTITVDDTDPYYYNIVDNGTISQYVNVTDSSYQTESVSITGISFSDSTYADTYEFSEVETYLSTRWYVHTAYEYDQIELTSDMIKSLSIHIGSSKSSYTYYAGYDSLGMSVSNYSLGEKEYLFSSDGATYRYYFVVSIGDQANQIDILGFKISDDGTLEVDYDSTSINAVSISCNSDTISSVDLLIDSSSSDYIDDYENYSFSITESATKHTWSVKNGESDVTLTDSIIKSTKIQGTSSSGSFTATYTDDELPYSSFSLSGNQYLFSYEKSSNKYYFIVEIDTENNCLSIRGIEIEYDTYNGIYEPAIGDEFLGLETTINSFEFQYDELNIYIDTISLGSDYSDYTVYDEYYTYWYITYNGTYQVSSFTSEMIRLMSIDVSSGGTTYTATYDADGISFSTFALDDNQYLFSYEKSSTKYYFIVNVDSSYSNLAFCGFEVLDDCSVAISDEYFGISHPTINAVTVGEYSYSTIGSINPSSVDDNYTINTNAIIIDDNNNEIAYYFYSEGNKVKTITSSMIQSLKFTIFSGEVTYDDNDFYISNSSLSEYYLFSYEKSSLRYYLLVDIATDSDGNNYCRVIGFENGAIGSNYFGSSNSVQAIAIDADVDEISSLDILLSDNYSSDYTVSNGSAYAGRTNNFYVVSISGHETQQLTDTMFQSLKIGLSSADGVFTATYDSTGMSLSTFSLETDQYLFSYENSGTKYYIVVYLDRDNNQIGITGFKDSNGNIIVAPQYYGSTNSTINSVAISYDAKEISYSSVSVTSSDYDVVVDTSGIVYWSLTDVSTGDQVSLTSSVIQTLSIKIGDYTARYDSNELYSSPSSNTSLLSFDNYLFSYEISSTKYYIIIDVSSDEFSFSILGFNFVSDSEISTNTHSVLGTSGSIYAFGIQFDLDELTPVAVLYDNTEGLLVSSLTVGLTDNSTSWYVINKNTEKQTSLTSLMIQSLRFEVTTDDGYKLYATYDDEGISFSAAFSSKGYLFSFERNANKYYFVVFDTIYNSTLKSQISVCGFANFANSSAQISYDYYNSKSSTFDAVAMVYDLCYKYSYNGAQGDEVLLVSMDVSSFDYSGIEYLFSSDELLSYTITITGSESETVSGYFRTYFNSPSSSSLISLSSSGITFASASDKTYDQSILRLELYGFYSWYNSDDNNIYNYSYSTNRSTLLTSSSYDTTIDFKITSTFSWAYDSTSYDLYDGETYVATIYKPKGSSSADTVTSTDGLVNYSTSIKYNSNVYYNIVTTNFFSTTTGEDGTETSASANAESYYDKVSSALVIGCYRDQIEYSILGDWDYFKLISFRWQVSFWCKTVNSKQLSTSFVLSKGISFDYFFDGDVELGLFYIPFKISYWIMVIACGIIIKTLGECIVGAIKRFYYITIYFLAMPAVASTVVLDDGKRLNDQIIKPIIQQVLAAYGVLLALNVFFVLLIPVESMSNIFTQADIDTSGLYFLQKLPFSYQILNKYVYIVFILVAFSMIKVLPQFIADMIGAGNIHKPGETVGSVAGGTLKEAGDVVTGKPIRQGIGNLRKKKKKTSSNRDDDDDEEDDSQQTTDPSSQEYKKTSTNRMGGGDDAEAENAAEGTPQGGGGMPQSGVGGQQSGESAEGDGEADASAESPIAGGATETDNEKTEEDEITEEAEAAVDAEIKLEQQLNGEAAVGYGIKTKEEIHNEAEEQSKRNFIKHLNSADEIGDINEDGSINQISTESKNDAINAAIAAYTSHGGKIKADLNDTDAVLKEISESKNNYAREAAITAADESLKANDEWYNSKTETGNYEKILTDDNNEKIEQRNEAIETKKAEIREARLEEKNIDDNLRGNDVVDQEVYDKISADTTTEGFKELKNDVADRHGQIVRTVDANEAEEIKAQAQLEFLAKKSGLSADELIKEYGGKKGTAAKAMKKIMADKDLKTIGKNGKANSGKTIDFDKISGELEKAGTDAVDKKNKERLANGAGKRIEFFADALRKNGVGNVEKKAAALYAKNNGGADFNSLSKAEQDQFLYDNFQSELVGADRKKVDQQYLESLGITDAEMQEDILSGVDKNNSIDQVLEKASEFNSSMFVGKDGKHAYSYNSHLSEDQINSNIVANMGSEAFNATIRDLDYDKRRDGESEEDFNKRTASFTQTKREIARDFVGRQAAAAQNGDVVGEVEASVKSSEELAQDLQNDLLDEQEQAQTYQEIAGSDQKLKSAMKVAGFAGKAQVLYEAQTGANKGGRRVKNGAANLGSGIATTFAGGVTRKGRAQKRDAQNDYFLTHATGKNVNQSTVTNNFDDEFAGMSQGQIHRVVMRDSVQPDFSSMTKQDRAEFESNKNMISRLLSKTESNALVNVFKNTNMLGQDNIVQNMARMQMGKSGKIEDILKNNPEFMRSVIAAAGGKTNGAEFNAKFNDMVNELKKDQAALIRSLKGGISDETIKAYMRSNPTTSDKYLNLGAQNLMLTLDKGERSVREIKAVEGNDAMLRNILSVLGTGKIGQKIDDAQFEKLKQQFMTRGANGQPVIEKKYYNQVEKIIKYESNHDDNFRKNLYAETTKSVRGGVASDKTLNNFFNSSYKVLERQVSGEKHLYGSLKNQDGVSAVYKGKKEPPAHSKAYIAWNKDVMKQINLLDAKIGRYAAMSNQSRNSLRNELKKQIINVDSSNELKMKALNAPHGVVKSVVKPITTVNKNQNITNNYANQVYTTNNKGVQNTTNLTQELYNVKQMITRLENILSGNKEMNFGSNYEQIIQTYLDQNLDKFLKKHKDLSSNSGYQRMDPSAKIEEQNRRYEALRSELEGQVRVLESKISNANNGGNSIIDDLGVPEIKRYTAYIGSKIESHIQSTSARIAELQASLNKNKSGDNQLQGEIIRLRALLEQLNNL